MLPRSDTACHLLQTAPRNRAGHSRVPSCQVAGGWRLGHDSPFAVQYAPAAVLDGRIWVAGGLLGPKHATTKTEFYDPTLDTWSPGPPLPIALHHAMMVAYQNTLWVIGGFVPQGSNVLAAASARVLILNLAQNRWTDGPATASCARGRRGGGGGEQDRRRRRADRRIPAAGQAHRDFRRHELARRRRHSGSGQSPGGRVGRDLPVRRRRAQDIRNQQHHGGAALRPGDRPVDPADAHAGRCQRARRGSRRRPADHRRRRQRGSPCSTPSGHTTWPPRPGPPCRTSPAARTGMGVAAYRNVLYALDGAAKPGHIASTSTVQILTAPSPPAAGCWGLAVGA